MKHTLRRSFILAFLMVLLCAEALAVSGSWVQSGDDWKWQTKDGSFLTSSWVKNSKHWYYMDDTGCMVTGFADLDGSTYYFDASGCMVTGWKQIEDGWYYFSSSGAMIRDGWMKDYYFGHDGKMLVNTVTPDGYQVDSSGKWIDTGACNAGFEAEILRLVNEARNAAGLSSLVLDPTLTAAARVRASEITSVYDHVRPDGRDCFSVLSDVGRGFEMAAENIAMGQKTPAQVFRAWMESPGHYANIMDPALRRIGIGALKWKKHYYWAQIFTD
ncbi:MAG: hypothetical protein IJ246_10250 [Clostridia bacterium]|nr:hypothetical protein [Clostridia bacterium]